MEISKQKLTSLHHQAPTHPISPAGFPRTYVHTCARYPHLSTSRRDQRMAGVPVPRLHFSPANSCSTSSAPGYGMDPPCPPWPRPSPPLPSRPVPAGVPVARAASPEPGMLAPLSCGGPRDAKEAGSKATLLRPPVPGAIDASASPRGGGSPGSTPVPWEPSSGENPGARRAERLARGACSKRRLLSCSRSVNSPARGEMRRASPGGDSPRQEAHASGEHDLGGKLRGADVETHSIPRSQKRRRGDV